MNQLSDKDACQLLDADHIAVMCLFVDYARLAMAHDAGAHAKQRLSIAMKICDELMVHAQIEEEIFYPALQAELSDASGLLDEAKAEHQEANELISDIRSVNEANAAMDTLVAELNVLIGQHVKEERDDLFPRAKAAPGLDLIELGSRLHKRQQELQQELQAA